MRGDLRYLLFGFATQHFAAEDPIFHGCCRAIVEALDQPQFSRIELTEHKIVVLFALSSLLVERPQEREVVHFVALQRLRDETGFDPMALPSAAKLLRTRDGRQSEAAYRHLLDAFGLIAIAWQLYVYGMRLVLTEDAYKQTISERIGPLN